jgi:hypothetical protein
MTQVNKKQPMHHGGYIHQIIPAIHPMNKIKAAKSMTLP